MYSQPAVSIETTSATSATPTQAALERFRRLHGLLMDQDAAARNTSDHDLLLLALDESLGSTQYVAAGAIRSRLFLGLLIAEMTRETIGAITRADREWIMQKQANRDMIVRAARRRIAQLALVDTLRKLAESRVIATDNSGNAL